MVTAVTRTYEKHNSGNNSVSAIVVLLVSHCLCCRPWARVEGAQTCSVLYYEADLSLSWPEAGSNKKLALHKTKDQSVRALAATCYLKLEAFVRTAMLFFL